MLQWVFFDLGGTLLDDIPFHDHIYREMLDILARGGYNVNMEEFVEARDLMVRKRVPMLKALIRHFTGKQELVEPMVKELLMRIEGKGPVLQTSFPESDKVIKTLKGQYKLGVIANQQIDIHNLLKKLGWDKIFEVTVISDEVKLFKPDTRIFQTALDRAGCSPFCAAMVGDRVDNDIAPAKRIGMKTVRFKAGIFCLQEPTTEEEKPDCEILSLSDLQKALEHIR